MSAEPITAQQDLPVEISLRQPGLAAFWAWLWPGAGHLYQKRYAKGVLFMVCILTTYFFGLAMGGGHVVYASWDSADRRWQYICQVGVGAPALPALVQSLRVRRGQEPLWNGVMAPPVNVGHPNPRRDQLSRWYKDYHSMFELGTLFTVVAGLLNVLAVYDAYAGPFMATSEEEDKPPPSREKEGDAT